MKPTVFFLSLVLLCLPEKEFSDYQTNGEKESVISACLQNLQSKGINLKSGDGLYYLDCTILIVASQSIGSDLRPELFGEKVCVVDETVLFSLSSDSFIEISRMDFFKDSAEVELQIRPNDYFELKLSKKGNHWLVH